MIIARTGRQRSPRATLVLSCACVLVLLFWALLNSSGAGLSSSLAAGTSAVKIAALQPSFPQNLNPCCSWTPYLLSDKAQRWALDASRIEVPTLVAPIRRHLSLALALGALEQLVPGDFVETGTWRGGMSALLLKALNDYDVNVTRQLWAADSFQGLPDAVDKDGGQGNRGEMAATRPDFEEVIKTLTTEWQLTQVPQRLQVLEGWFNETLPVAPITSIAFLRLDGDLYTSTRDTLAALYDKVSPGGLVYLDDYGSFSGCKVATDEFRSQRNDTLCPLMRSSLPEQGVGVPGSDATWESAWWVKAAC